MEGREFCNERGCAGQGESDVEASMESSVTNHIAKGGPLDMPIAVLGKVQNDENELLNSDSHQHLETESRQNTCIKIKKFCSCPPQGLLAVGVTNVIMVALIWGVVWSITGSECLPGGNLFGILALFLCAVIGGKLVGLIRISKLPPLPPLLGMLLAGFLIRNIPVVTDQVKINFKWSAALRNIALAIILARAGLGLDPKALRKLKAVCLRLSFGPCAIETCCAAVLSHFLMGLPLTWGFMLGFVLGAVSPAVVVPSMLLLQKEGYGVDKGIPTLLMAAGSFDDILAITGFNTCFGMAFSSGSTLNTIIRGVLEVVIGMAAGLLLGFFLNYFPSKDQENLKWKRSYLILALSIFAVFGSLSLGFPGSGGLCTLVMAFLAGMRWSGEKTVVEDIVAVGWDIFQPLLFSLIGSEIQIASLRPETVGKCRKKHYGGVSLLRGQDNFTASKGRWTGAMKSNLGIVYCHTWNCINSADMLHILDGVLGRISAEGENIYFFSMDAKSYCSGCYWFSCFGYGKKHWKPRIRRLWHGCANCSFSSNSNHSTHWSINYWADRTQNVAEIRNHKYKPRRNSGG